MTTMNAASLLPLEMSRHLHRAPPLLPPPPLQPAPRSPPPPPPGFGLCAAAMTHAGRTSPTARPRPSSTSLMALAADKPAGGGGGFLGFHGGGSGGGAPTAANSADNNTCRLIDYRNAQVAAFHVSRAACSTPPPPPHEPAGLFTAHELN